jgi:acetyl-CoA carboxylase carboxyl transferase subunit beta
MPEGLWVKCKACGTTIYMKDLVANLQVCKACGYHFSQPSEERVRALFDENSFVELWSNLMPLDRLEFIDKEPYPKKLLSSAAKSGVNEAAVAGTGVMDGQPVAICMLDFRFMGGSMGTVVGEKVTRTLELARADRIPAIVISCSGGARMHEGALSLMQMAKTSAAIARLHADGGLYISVLANPTTGGVMASFAALGDLIFAEPGALIGFAGPRVIQETLRTELPEGFQTSEFLMERGFIDRIVTRESLRQELSRAIRLLWTYDRKTLSKYAPGLTPETQLPAEGPKVASSSGLDSVRGKVQEQKDRALTEEA